MSTEDDEPKQTTPIDGVVAAVRQPEYTGANRCIPCTIVNLGFAAILTAIGWWLTPLLGIGVGLVSVAAIWLRGYLIPGTPTLTKQYFPDRVLAWFDKAPGPDLESGELDVESILVEEGVLVETADGSDFRVANDFRRGWRQRMRANDRNRDAASLAWLLDIDADRLSLEPQGEAMVARIDGQWAGQWESRAAFVADVAAAAEFEDRGGVWTRLPTWARSEVLGGLRLFLERCPTCDGEVILEQTVKESCCRDIDVLVLACQGCGARLFETPVDTEQLEAMHAAETEPDPQTVS